jgi:hypothetical protein
MPNKHLERVCLVVLVIIIVLVYYIILDKQCSQLAQRDLGLSLLLYRLLLVSHPLAAVKLELMDRTSM